jgi:hypothetical protein
MFHCHEIKYYVTENFQMFKTFKFKKKVIGNTIILNIDREL